MIRGSHPSARSVLLTKCALKHASGVSGCLPTVNVPKTGGHARQCPRSKTSDQIASYMIFIRMESFTANAFIRISEPRYLRRRNLFQCGRIPGTQKLIPATRLSPEWKKAIHQLRRKSILKSASRSALRFWSPCYSKSCSRERNKTAAPTAAQSESILPERQP